MTEFAIKDSGQRQEFSGGMVRDTTEGKIDWLNLRFGPLYRRVAEHLTKGRIKYPDPAPGVPNWTLAEGREEALRAKQSAARHFEQWLQGELDEDHASAVVFNMNLFEYLREKDPSIPAGFGTAGALVVEEPAPGPLRRGDRVEVTEGNTGHLGDRGEVVGKDPVFGVAVRLDTGRTLGFYERELKRVEEPERPQTIREAILNGDMTVDEALELPACNGHCLDCYCGPEDDDLEAFVQDMGACVDCPHPEGCPIHARECESPAKGPAPCS